MEGVIKGHTFWFGVSLYGLPVIGGGSAASEAVKAVPPFWLMIAYIPGRNDIVMLDMGVREVGTQGGTLYSPRDGRCRPAQSGESCA